MHSCEEFSESFIIYFVIRRSELYPIHWIKQPEAALSLGLAVRLITTRTVVCIFVLVLINQAIGGLQTCKYYLVFDIAVISIKSECSVVLVLA